LFDQGVDFFGRQLAGVFGHAALAVSEDGAQVLGGRRRAFFRNERWPPEVAALGGFTVTLCAVLLETGFAVRVAPDGGVWAETPNGAKKPKTGRGGKP